LRTPQSMTKSARLASISRTPKARSARRVTSSGIVELRRCEGGFNGADAGEAIEVSGDLLVFELARKSRLAFDLLRGLETGLEFGGDSGFGFDFGWALLKFELLALLSLLIETLVEILCESLVELGGDLESFSFGLGLVDGEILINGGLLVDELIEVDFWPESGFSFELGFSFGFSLELGAGRLDASSTTLGGAGSALLADGDAFIAADDSLEVDIFAEGFLEEFSLGGRDIFDIELAKTLDVDFDASGSGLGGGGDGFFFGFDIGF